MIKIRDELFFDIDRLLLISGKIENEELLKEKINLLVRDDFKQSETPYERLRKRYGVNAVDYNNMFPINGGICLSDACQLRCNYCSFSSNETEKKLASIDDVRVFVDFFIKNFLMRRLVSENKHEVLDIYLAGGGEPTYNWNLLVETVELIKNKCNSHNIPYTLGITTNCMLNTKQLDYIIENFNLITVSFDGLPEIQNKNRTTSNARGSFEYMGKSLEYLNEKHCPVVMRSTIWPEDYKRLPDMAEYIYDNYSNVSIWSAEPVNPRGRAEEKGVKTLNDDFLYYYIKAKNLIRDKGYKDNLVCGKFKDNIVDYVCGTAYGVNPWMLPDGKIVSCLDARENAALVGQISDNKLEKFTFKDDLAEKYIRGREKCRDCYAFRFCGGGCPLRYINKSEIDMAEKECAMIRKYWVYIFETLLNEKDIFGWTYKKYNLSDFPDLKIYQIWRSTWTLE